MKNVEDKRKPFDVELERENECGICLEPCTKMVLPNCCHTMCVNCYHDWYTLILFPLINFGLVFIRWEWKNAIVLGGELLNTFICICFRNTRSESCPFCRGSLERVNSGDLWVLTCSSDVTDVQTVLKEDLLRLHLYINSLPKDIPDALFLMYSEYLF